ncbi:hypothetical protein O181_035180 [Austropuccinia psidii MF-1]|uniref:Uncharacterized protein n=1 Tax=Austropuccinia psidii MF-1 TaxID=1389203 RepID=A0A9Q3D4A4_9BASI|nr:hypothetical protein [Austropuccinia psidii MF-1]
MNQPENRPGIIRIRRSDSGNYSRCQRTQINHSHTGIHLPLEQEHQTRGPGGYGSSSSAPPTPQRHIPMKHGKKEFNLASHWEELGAS